MQNNTLLDDLEMAEIGKVSNTLAKLLQLLVNTKHTTGRDWFILL